SGSASAACTASRSSHPPRLWHARLDRGYDLRAHEVVQHGDQTLADRVGPPVVDLARSFEEPEHALSRIRREDHRDAAGDVARRLVELRDRRVDEEGARADL